MGSASSGRLLREDPSSELSDWQNNIHNLHTVVPPDPNHFGLGALESFHVAGLPLFQLKLPPPWRSPGEDS